MKVKLSLLAALMMSVAACTETSVMPMSQDTFKVSSNTECGRNEAQDAAFKRAAIEVIKMGGDRFIILNTAADSETGLYYDYYLGLSSYTTNQHDLIVRTLERGDPQYSNGLSARQVLGPEWQTLVAEGLPDTCM